MKFLIFFSFFFLASAFEDLSNGKCSEKFVKSFLSRANYYRAKHSVGPLSLDDKGLSNYAQLTAYNIIAKVAYTYRNFYGVNKAWFDGVGGQEIDGHEPIEMWYKEVNKYFAYGAEPDQSTSSSWHHFTQLVWKNASKVGVGCSWSADKKSFYVVAYFDSETTPGIFKNNVFPPKK